MRPCSFILITPYFIRRGVDRPAIILYYIMYGKFKIPGIFGAFMEYPGLSGHIANKAPDFLSRHCHTQSYGNDSSYNGGCMEPVFRELKRYTIPSQDFGFYQFRRNGLEQRVIM